MTAKKQPPPDFWQMRTAENGETSDNKARKLGRCKYGAAPRLLRWLENEFERLRVEIGGGRA